MKLTETTFQDGTPVDGYGPGFFRIGGQRYEGAVLVLPGQVAAWGGYEDTAPLIAAAGDVDVILVGTGAMMTHLPPAFRSALEQAGIGVEQMASEQACRTYNVLLGEGRRVALALLPA
ncbi:Mth938-like domain-containing protein [Palleronia caenipelagi]|uniref:Mth938-like domain-containing protein n=1 Tax=Palleronia caenipelagi TaxID=2489174 RepID=A0A547Q350_9RHOB|nr:Mth938-like domain-containing protein [Palleronia caenipelagi]TRD20790.1 hypothetical protein FEV53_09190 [Palleronia caenipelagi]